MTSINTSVCLTDEANAVHSSGRILLVVGQLACGGTERQLYLLARHLVARGFEVHVAVSNETNDESYRHRLLDIGASLVGLNQGSSTVPTKLRKLMRLRHYISRHQPHIVHSMSFRLNCMVTLAAVGSSAAVLGSVRNDFEFCRREYGWLAGLVNSRWPRTLLFNSIESARKAQSSHVLFRPRNIEFVRNGVECDRADQPRAATSAANKCVGIVGIGSLTAKKRWDRLVDAARHLKAMGLSFSVQVVGDGSERDRLEAEVKADNLGQAVRFVGKSDDIGGILAESDLLVHTAEYEGSPNVIMEAMSAGLAIVATDAGDAPHLVQHGRTGFVVRRDDDEALKTSIVRLVTDHKLRQSFASAAQEIAQREFGVDRMVDNMLIVYRNIGWKSAT